MAFITELVEQTNWPFALAERRLAIDLSFRNLVTKLSFERNIATGVAAAGAATPEHTAAGLAIRD